MAWRNAIKSTFKGVAFYALESGRGDFKSPKRGPVHAHVLASDSDGFALKFANTKKLVKVKNLKGILSYLAKPSELYSLESWLDWKAAKLTSSAGKSPRLRGWLTSTKRQSWNVLPMVIGNSIENEATI